MALLSPQVDGPLSECSSSVRVEGQVTGATVKLQMTGHAGSIGGGVASWSDQTFPLAGGVSLTAGATVQALQTLGAETSPLGPGITVQKKPPIIGPLAFQSHLYVCGQCLWLVGAVPGAQVNVKVLGVARGAGISADGNARLGLAPAIGAADILTAQQIACGTPGAIVTGPKPDLNPGERQRTLPPPSLPGPLHACDAAVLVSSVFEGATVTIHRTGGAPESACFDATALWFILGAPLALGEKVTASQAFPSCKINGAQTAPPLTVQPTVPVPPPTVLKPLCGGQTSVTLTDLKPGAQVEIFQSGVSLGVGQAPEGTTFTFPTPALVGGTSITATQTLCKRSSVQSNAVPVDAAPDHMLPPNVPGPLFECASVVRVTNVHVGARVFVFSTLLGAEISDAQAFASTVDVNVAPLLIAGDRIFATQIGCGLKSLQSGHVLVKAAPKLDPPTVGWPLTDCMTAVPVNNVVPGAIVDVDVNNLWRGSVAAAAANVEVPISGRLSVGDLVTARQRLCNMISAFSQSDTRVVHSEARDWPMYHHDAQHTGDVFCSDITRATVSGLALKHTVPLDGHMISVPAIVDAKIYVGSSKPDSVGPGGGTLYRIDLATGAIEKQYSFVTAAGKGSNQGETGIGCTPAVVGGKAYFSCLDGQIRCVDANTFLLDWATDLRNPSVAQNQPVTNQLAETWSSPLVVNGKVYVGAGEGELGAWGFCYCLDANTGKVIWLFSTNQFQGGVDNAPNVVPASSVDGTIPPGFVGFSVAPDPASKGSSVWSSFAHHAGLNRIFVGTGNATPDSPLPDALYGSGMLALDAGSGAFVGFFQPAPADCYRPDDDDADVPCPPMLYSRPGQDVVTFGSKMGAIYLIDPTTMNVLARRQLLPKDGSGNPLPAVDQHAHPGENLWGVFASATVDRVYQNIFYGLGGYAGIDAASTPFMRICDWTSLADAWPVAVGADTVTRYTSAAPPMYATAAAGLSSPVVVNDVVFVSTSDYAEKRASLYAFATSNGVLHWSAPGFVSMTDNPYSLGPAIYGNFVVVGAGSQINIYSF
jgi:outer membrane protein assembly factor BamB